MSRKPRGVNRAKPPCIIFREASASSFKTTIESRGRPFRWPTPQALSMLSAKRDKGDFESMRAAVLLMAVGCVESLVSKLQDCCMYVLLDR